VLLDIDVTLGLALGANVIVFEAPPSTSWQTMFNTMIDGGVTVIGNSWTTCEDQHSLADVQSIDSILQSAAASGISVFNASGDTGSACLGQSPDTVGVPASSPSATAVGGTSLATAPGYVYGGETWWNGKGGFGVSRHFARPVYQIGFTSVAMRSVPDVSLVADPRNGTFICQASKGGCPNGLFYGGTSMSAPVMAAYAAILNQSRGTNVGAFNQASTPWPAAARFILPPRWEVILPTSAWVSPNLDVLDRLLTSEALGAPDPAASWVFTSSSILGGKQYPLGFDIPADGSDSGTVTVVLRDGNGHTVSGKSVRLTASGGSHAVISPSDTGVTSLNNGAVVFKVTDLTRETVTFTARDTTDGLDLAEIAQLKFVVPPAASGGISAAPPVVAANQIDQGTVTVRLLDKLDRPTPGKRVRIEQGSGHSTISGPDPSVTDPNGQIEFTVTNGTAEAVTYTAFDETDKVPVPESTEITFSGSSTSCAGAPPTARPGYALSTFATGFAVKDFAYSGINIYGCQGATPPAFGPDGAVYVTDSSTATSTGSAPPAAASPARTW
jgi:hypothetical protein